MRPLFLAVAVIGKAVYAVLFAWWLNPVLDRRAQRELVDDIKVHLHFLLSDSDSLQIRRAKWPTVEISYHNLLFTVVRWRDETAVSVAPRHVPTESRELGPLIAAIEGRHFSQGDIVTDLADVERLLRPRLEALNASFSQEKYTGIRERI